MDSGAGWRLGRRPGLDGLRGVAIVLVLLAHVLPHHIGAAGAVGVTAFFALSGFLITALLLAENDRGPVSLRGFYGRRARRVLPALVPAVTVAVVIEVGLGMDPRAEVIMVVAYMSNWAMAFSAPMVLLAHTWSLAVEEQFYLIWPGIFVLAMRRNMSSERLARWCLIASGTSLGLRLLLWAVGVPASFIGGATPTVADALLLGCALAAALHSGWVPTIRVWIVSGGSCALIGAVLWAWSAPPEIAATTLTTLAAAPLLLVGLRSPRALTGNVVRWLGRRSYGLYLWHYILVLPGNWHMWSLPVWAGLALAFVAAEASWWLVERPFLRQRTAARPVAATATAAA